MLNWNDVLNFATKGNLPPDRRGAKKERAREGQQKPEQYPITRKKSTETRSLCRVCSRYDPGKYVCVCCDTELFDSTIKFDSKTGWPSFTQPMKENVISYHKDVSFGMTRVEVLCSVCDAHLGHVFPDGPPPSGLRFCINSESLRLVMAAAAK